MTDSMRRLSFRYPCRILRIHRACLQDKQVKIGSARKFVAAMQDDSENPHCVRIEDARLFCGLPICDLWVMPLQSADMIIDSDTATAFARLLGATNERAFSTAATDLKLYDADDRFESGQRLSLLRLRTLMHSLCVVAALDRKHKGHRVFCSCV